MNQPALLSQLKDIHAPAAIWMLPLTVTWYVLFGLLLVLLIFVAIKLTRLYFKKRRRQQSLDLLAATVSLYQDKPAETLANISILLRRVALAKYKRSDVASLNNRAWLKFLDNEMQTTEFSNGIGQILVTAPYQKTPTVNISDLTNLIERWIRRVL